MDKQENESSHGKAISDQLQFLDASSIAEGIREHKFSSFEIVEAYFDRIERYNSKYTAIITLNKEDAITRAKEADLALSQGENWGPLHGVPITIKDAFITKGLRTTVGHRMFEHFIPEEDAEVVILLKNAGAILLGKTNCASLCHDFQTRNSIFGMTSNPWDKGRTSGGSTGGEAVAITLGLSPLGIGSDTGGSIRVPSSYCGIYGLKTSCQKISRQGLIPPLPGTVDLDTHLTVVGPMARSIRDLQLCFQILTGEEVKEIKCKEKLKIAWTVDFPGVAIDEKVKSTIVNSIIRLKNKDIYLEKTNSAFEIKGTFQKALLLTAFEFTLMKSKSLLIKILGSIRRFVAFLMGGTFESYKRTLMYRNERINELDHFLNQWDCWLLPVTPTTAFPHNPKHKSIVLKQDGKGKKVSYFSAIASLTLPFNFTGHPSVVIPIGRDNQGLPISVQLVGQRGRDLDLLEIAARIDKKLGGIAPIKLE